MQPLPQRFALFDDTPVWRIPYANNRITLFQNGSPFSSDVTADIAYIQEAPVAKILHKASALFWWYTPYSIALIRDTGETLMFPCIDTEPRLTLQTSEGLTAINETDGGCMSRQCEHRILRSQMLSAVDGWHICYSGQTETQAPEPEQGPPPTIPHFVAQALVQALIRKEEVCPITQEPFAACESVSVTPCFHSFDGNALSIWSQTHIECPVCKGPTAGTLTLKKEDYT
jgi:hypothetical protein